MEHRNTGFAVAPNRVLTTADTIAGAAADSVFSRLTATATTRAVSFDPDLDLSILDVPNLTTPPLTFAASPAPRGTEAQLMGYPDTGDFAATPVTVQQLIRLRAPDLYRSKTVLREVYTIKGLWRWAVRVGR
jgi:hypothetical protein